MTTNINDPRGSLWNKWDLHIHTDASDGKGTCQEILDAAKAKGIKCIAVTDHHTFDNVDEMKDLAEPMGITVISGVEFRTEYGKASVHMIGLFPDEYNGTKLDKEFLTENVLHKANITRSEMIMKGREYLKDKDASNEKCYKVGMFLVQVKFMETADLIHKYGGLVSVHAGDKDNSIDREMKHEGSSAKNVSIEDSLGPVKEELFREGYIDICDIKKPKEAEFYQKTFGKPSITTSDAHEPKDVGTRACWIKGDPTFDGLRQIIAEPERISFQDPEILQRVTLNPDKFIDSLLINRVAGATMQEKWFDNISIPLNPGLVAIIGNKGSGKSALTDIIALCGDTSNQNWAFLTTSKFRMARPYNRSKQTEAYIQWVDGSKSETKTLDQSCDLSKPERVKYIPQNFLETLCTTEKDSEFEAELRKIIYQYLDSSDKYGLSNLEAIIDYLTQENAKSCNEIQSRIRKLNAEIIEKESMTDPAYRTKLVNELTYRMEQLKNAQAAKPKEVPKPNVDEDPEAKKAKDKIEKYIELSLKQKADLDSLEKERDQQSKAIQDLKMSKESLDRLFKHFKATKAEIMPLFEKNGIDYEKVLSLTYEPSIIVKKIDDLTLILVEISKHLDVNVAESLINQHARVVEVIEQTRLKLSAPEREYQKYLKDKQDWEKMIEDINGTPEKEGTINNLQSRLDYIDNRLSEDLSNLINQRIECVKVLMGEKQKVLETYDKLFAPIVKFIEEYRDELRDYPIEFNSSFVIRNFEEKFFSCISQQVAGSYCGKEQGQSRVRSNIDNTDVSNIDSIINFATTVNDDLLHDKRDGQKESRFIENQLKKGYSKQELYDYIYCMDYVQPHFQIKMNGKPLSSLSPGERGALLLLLYLFIDMDDKPLIIDQPEENLDNESVFRYLVHFIKVAKKKRQIIMVTHNPNLAVVCDADQIIHIKIDKLHDNTVSVISGAIENRTINKIIVDILEGTYPAFHNRDCKYFDKIY